MEVNLTRREVEVLNTNLSAEISKLHLRYAGREEPERLSTLYSLRDKLCTRGADHSDTQRRGNASRG